MSSTETHDTFAIAVSFVSTPVLVHYFDYDIPSAVMLSLGILTQLVMSADLDVNRSKIAKRWKFKPLILWWKWYGLLFKHRGISHTPLIGTITRLLWIFPIPLAMYHVSSDLTIFYLLGVAIGDLLHWFLDYVL